MNKIDPLGTVLTQALQLPPRERLHLVEHLVASLENEIATDPAVESTAGHWGQSLNDLINALDWGEWEALDLDDPVAWVKERRAEEMTRRQTDWNDPK